MSKVSFYLLEHADARAQHLACKLCQRALMEGLDVLLLCRDDSEQHVLDELLWTYQPTSFIPHRISDARIYDPQVAVHLSTSIEAYLAARQDAIDTTHEEDPMRRPLLCINLAAATIDPAQVERIFEIIEAHEEAKIQGRTRYRAYQQQGITPVMHRLAQAI